ncbi:MAG: type II toxin-antitoxin system HicB family antitoxin [Treponema sp.]|jgi:predicted RNase H-like HicB family nuclease|nr:type II toxin-antitoxin system HicB family antitoxin [Treponema sp.]
MVAKLSMLCSEQSNGAYVAICPEIKGCFTQGDTYEEASANLKELVEITIREELKKADIEEILLSKTKIFSEFEIAV